ncbi:MAG: hypothetical protein M0R32_03150 [Candidatus Cloacimonetes bacterium]|jgi:hypothetical protein|nr:hypothetical protein [Candidatus Cloacimonadota bacterium]
MGRTLYICKENGDVFKYFPEIEQSSETVVEHTDYLFTAFKGNDDVLEAFACASNVSAFDIENSESSSSSITLPSQSSESSITEMESGGGEEEDVVFYISRKEYGYDDSTLSCYSTDGKLISEFQLPISEEILSLEVWPNDGNTIVATSENNIYVLDLSTGTPSVVFAEAAKKLTKGLAYHSGSGNSVYFWIGTDAGQFYNRSVISINKNTANNNIITVYSTKISREILGFANYLDRVFIAFPETESSTSPRIDIWDPSGSKDANVPVSGLDIASAVYACSYLYPYLEEFLEVEVLEYDSETGALKNNSSMSTFGIIASGEVSETKVIRLKAKWAQSIKNVKLGLTGSSLLNDFSPGILKFGTSPTFIPSYQPSEDFEGMNETDASDDYFNKTVENSSYPKSNISDYIYLSVSLPQKYFGVGHFQLKWFFDFDIYEDDYRDIPAKTCQAPEGEFSSDSSFSSISSSSSSSISSSYSTQALTSDNCSLDICFKTFTIPDQLTVYYGGSVILDTGMISTGDSFACYSLIGEYYDEEIRVEVNAPTVGTAWELEISGCGKALSTSGGQGYYCWPDPCSSLSSGESESSPDESYTSESSPLSSDSSPAFSSDSSDGPSSDSSVGDDDPYPYYYPSGLDMGLNYGIGLDLL